MICKKKILFAILGALCLTPLISPPLALFLGILMAQFMEHPFALHNKKVTQILLQFSVVGLGFGMNGQMVVAAGRDGFSVTAISIVGTLVFGFLLGKLFKVERKISFLISAGTAICGGSAIAAMSPVLNANEKQVSIALGTVFILNSVALFAFPFIGGLLELSQSQFGLWCAIAIHDTSSVVGAAAKYGQESLVIATTVKLVRALWIIPLALLASWIFQSQTNRIKLPYFIGFFVLAILANTYVSPLQAISPTIVLMAKAGLTLTLFLIGSGMSRKSLRSVGFKPILQGLIIWVVISAVSLYYLYAFTE